MLELRLGKRARETIIRSLKMREQALYAMAVNCEAAFGNGTAYEDMRAQARYSRAVADVINEIGDDPREILDAVEPPA
jgi:hypothetical protein